MYIYIYKYIYTVYVYVCMYVYIYLYITYCVYCVRWITERGYLSVKTIEIPGSYVIDKYVNRYDSNLIWYLTSNILV